MVLTYCIAVIGLVPRQRSNPSINTDWSCLSMKRWPMCRVMLISTLKESWNTLLIVMFIWNQTLMWVIEVHCLSSIIIVLQYGDQQKSASVDVELTDSSSATMFQVDTESNLSLSYMQSVTPNLILGGLGTYSNKSKKITTAFGGQISVGDNTITGQWDNNVSWIRLFVLLFVAAVVVAIAAYGISLSDTCLWFVHSIYVTFVVKKLC